MHVKETDLHENVTKRLRELLAYVNHLGRLNEKPVFMVAEYKQLYLWEHQLKGRIGIQHDLTGRVSESLPSDFGSFDLVIIDEASQSDITALPAILRGKKLLIVGDDKQVSPTAAFFAEEKILQLKHNFLRGQPFAQLLLPDVSIYDLANAVFPKIQMAVSRI